LAVFAFTLAAWVDDIVGWEGFELWSGSWEWWWKRYLVYEADVV